MTSKVPSLQDLDKPADRIRLHVQADKRPVVLVEGESDKRFLRRLSNDQMAIFPCAGRSNAVTITAELNGTVRNAVVCVVDRDFDDVDGKDDGEFPVFPYENADLEGMLATAKVIAVLVDEYGSSDKIAKAGGFALVERSVSSIAIRIALLRRANALNGWGLAFDKVDLTKKINSVSLDFKAAAYCAALRATSAVSPSAQALVDIADGATKLDSPASCPRVGERYFRGRDYLAVVGVALTRWIGSQRRESVDAETLANVVRLSAASEPHVERWYADLLEYLQR